MEFCFEACTLLSNKSGLRHKSRLIWRISWQPFDAWFGCTLDRLQRHFEIFDTEIALVQVQLGVAQLDIGKEQRDRLDLLYEQLEEYIKTMQQQSERLDKVRVHQEERLKGEQIRTLKTWINAPQWEELHHAALTRTMPDSTEWLFSEATYADWITSVNQAWETSEPIDHGTLILQAKPGYGKTHLCSSVIERLSLGSATDAWVSYYYFNRAKPWTTDNVAAFRAILTQLFHNHRNDLELIDAGSLMMYNDLSGQATASKEEVLALLNWCLRRHPQGYIVIDALDESVDSLDFWTCLEVVLAASEAVDYRGSAYSSSNPHPQRSSLTTMTGAPRVVVFSRPDLSISNSVRQRCRIFQPHSRPLEILESYIGAMLQQLVSDDLLGTEADIDGLARIAAKHSGNMFLWVRLLEEYLTSDGLSIQERLDALDNLVFLEGLDNLYTTILNRIQKLSPKQTFEKVQRAFQWVDTAVRPLYVNELREAICLPTDGPLKNAHVPNFRKAIQKISGALLEITTDDCVCFIHTSVGDFLHQNRCSLLGTDVLDVLPVLASQQTKQYVAACLVSYITRCVTSEPLSGSSQVTPNYQLQCTRFPLLHYVVSFWPFHVGSVLRDCTYERLTTSQMNTGFHIPPQCYQLLQQVRDFVFDKKAVMVWVEASWLCQVDPNNAFNKLLDAVAQRELQRHIFHGVPAAEEASMKNLLKDIKDLAYDLARLSNEWSHVLSKTPNEIWEPSIQSQCRSRFWLDTSVACAERVVSTYESTLRTISLESKVSSDATEIGLLSLIVPNASWDKEEHIWRTFSGVKGAHTTLWHVCFEVWDLACKQPKFRFTMKIQPRERCGLPNSARDGKDLSVFYLDVPFTISHDLRKIVVMYDLAIIRLTNPSVQSENAHGCKIDHVFIEPRALHDFGYEIQNGWLQGVMFDQHNRFLLFHHSFSGLCVFKFLDTTGRPEHLTATRNVSLRKYERDLASVACFHPFLPLLLLVTDSNMMLWDFSSRRSGFHAIKKFRKLPTGINFSTCGNYVQEHFHDSMEIIDVRSLIRRVAKLPLVDTNVEYLTSSAPDNFHTPEREQSGKIKQYSHVSEPRVQLPNVITFSKNAGAGQASVSLIRQFTKRARYCLLNCMRTVLSSQKNLSDCHGPSISQRLSLYHALTWTNNQFASSLTSNREPGFASIWQI
ncbi:hypothetical protein BDV96DRAFT_275568 [Lophiotrema nucula]|uniref:NACHT domain-containing protein n=1 Tax=Lophiotrema nucula TaxID=690887 RepID=A0A6A5ZN02_9PLEO|nr:hypothetical protein BDV96DRAFT_275568 [Lophiotrema nucula]